MDKKQIAKALSTNVRVLVMARSHLDAITGATDLPLIIFCIGIAGWIRRQMTGRKGIVHLWRSDLQGSGTSNILVRF